MAARRRRGTCGSAARPACDDGAGPSFHVGFAVRLVGADSAGPSVDADAVGEGGGALEFCEDGFLVVEQIADQAIGISLLHGHRCLYLWPQNAWREASCKGGNISLVSGCKLN
jgi:hypothetical protein